jgi:hypothetical protein
MGNTQKSETKSETVANMSDKKKLENTMRDISRKVTENVLERSFQKLDTSNINIIVYNINVQSSAGEAVFRVDSTEKEAFQLTSDLTHDVFSDEVKKVVSDIASEISAKVNTANDVNAKQNAQLESTRGLLGQALEITNLSDKSTSNVQSSSNITSVVSAPQCCSCNFVLVLAC